MRCVKKKISYLFKIRSEAFVAIMIFILGFRFKIFQQGKSVVIGVGRKLGQIV